MADPLTEAITLAEEALAADSGPPPSLARILERLAHTVRREDTERLGYLAALSAEIGLADSAVRLLRSAGESAEMQNLAGVIAACHGDLNTAVEVLEGLAGRISDDRPLRYRVLTNLAVAYRRHGRIDDVERPAWGGAADPLAEFLLTMTDPARAAEEFRPGDPRALLVAMDAAGAELDRSRVAGDLESAESAVDVLEAVGQMLGSTLGDAHRHAALARANHASAAFDVALDHCDMDAAQAALGLLAEAVEALRDTRGPDDPEVVTVMNNLAIARFEVARNGSDVAEAVDGLAAAWHHSARALGPRHPDTLALLADLGNAHLEIALRNPSGAVIVEAVRVNMQAVNDLGADHPLAGRVANQLRECRGIRTISTRAERVASENDCSVVLSEVYLYLDLEASEERRQLIQEHLDECSTCLREYGIEHEVKTLVALAVDDETAPSDLRLRLLRKIAELVEGDAEVRRGAQ